MARMLSVALSLLFLFSAFSTVWADPPLNSGPFVLRFDQTFAIVWVDDQLPQFIVVGTDLGDFCTGTIVFDQAEALWVFVAQQTNVVTEVFTMDDARAQVWPIIGNPVGVCQAWANAGGVPLASGSLDMIAANNDLFTGANDEERWNSQSVQTNGLLTVPGDGSPVAVRAGLQWRWDGEDFSTFSATGMVRIH